MPARLIASSGPLKGGVFELPEGEWSVGRSTANQLCLNDPAVSRRHCIFSRSGERCTLRDLESHNNTLVNGQPVTADELRHGDEVRIGESIFVFVTGTDEFALPHSVDTQTKELRFEDSLYLSSVERPTPTSPRTTQHLKTLLRLSTMLHSFRNLQGAQGKHAQELLRQHLASLLLDLIPAEQADIIVFGGENGLLQPDQEILNRIRDQRVALLVDHSQNDGTMILAAPILVQGDTPAIIYLESSSPENRFDDGHLQLLIAVAEMAAVAWENASILGWLQDENERLQDELKIEHDMIGESAGLRELRRQIGKVAPSNANVLILGESGTGKELVARALHRNSPRAMRPFVAINCAAITDTLLESELFGHERGAFTGAVAQKRGKLEVADSGTVFLDEIAELSPLLQAKLLRVLQERELERVGGTDTIKLNIRLIAATNRDLEEAVRKGAFRQDLYYRLKVVTLKTPALREHPEDILPLADHFAKKCAAECARRIIGFAPQTRAYLQSYSWPGNVRELENAIESAVVLGSTEMILPEDLPDHVRAARPAEVTATLYEDAIEAAKRQVVLKAFDQADYDHETAAKILGLHPNYLHKLLRMMDLRTVLKRGGAGRA